MFSRERSRGTGPRATVGEAAARLTRSGSGDPELQFPAPILLIMIILKILLISCSYPAHIFNLTKTRKNSIMYPTFNSDFIFTST